MQGSLTIKQLMKRSGITLSQVASASETSVSDVSKLLNDNLRERILATALRLIVTQNKEVQEQLNPLEGYEETQTQDLSMWQRDHKESPNEVL
jgi:transcriptional regulator with XRE-family HTH domain